VMVSLIKTVETFQLFCCYRTRTANSNLRSYRRENPRCHMRPDTWHEGLPSGSCARPKRNSHVPRSYLLGRGMFPSNIAGGN
jgi:hypothetical protein